MKIEHNPIFKISSLLKHFEKREGVNIKHVCTTALDSGNKEWDVYYRDTPHPDYGNKYFAIRSSGEESMLIRDADVVEDLQFGMIKDDSGVWHYSRYRHDYKKIDGKTIDGGRAYTRGSGFAMFKVHDGEFINDVE